MTYWNAKPGCPEHHVEALERAVNAMPLEWRSPPQTGEVFPSILECERRLRGFTLVEGFDIVRNGEATLESLTVDLIAFSMASR
jgi:hypothetical protein